MFWVASADQEHPTVRHQTSPPVAGGGIHSYATCLVSTAAPGWVACLHDNLRGCSQSSTLPLVSSTQPDEMSTCRRSKVPHRIELRLAVVSYRCLAGAAPQYLADELQLVADIASRGRLRSASMARLHIPRTAHRTIGNRAFPVAAARVWNSLAPSTTSQSSLLSFRRALTTELFERSYGGPSNH